MAKKNQIHVTAKNRGFGLGFGAKHQVVVYTGKVEGPKTSALLTDVQCGEVEKWLNVAEDERSITDLVGAEDLTEALHNRLLHADTIEVVRILPKLLEKMSVDERGRIFVEPIGSIASETLKEIRKTRPHLRKDGFTTKGQQAYFEKLLQSDNKIEIAANGEDIQFNGVSMEALVVMLPGLLLAGDKASQVQTTQIIANAMHAAGEDKIFFGPLEDVNINRVVIVNANKGPCQDGVNNGRTTMIRSLNGPQLKFQGDIYTSSNLHFHPLKNATQEEGPVMNVDGEKDATPEFLLYKDAAHKKLCRKNPHLDPNRNVVGQLHTIYTTKGKRALLLGANVEIGAHNEEFGKYIDLLKKNRAGKPLEIIDDMTDANEVAAKAVPAGDLIFDPLACYKGRFDVDGVPEAPFMSMHLGGLKVNSENDIGLKEGKSDIFYRGVRVIYLPEAITISREQLKDLRELQPVLKSIDEDTCVHPVGRYQPPKQLFKDKIKLNAGDKKLDILSK